MEIRIVEFGEALGIVLPGDVLSKLKVGKGDVLHLVESPDGFRLTPYDPECEPQMEQARSVMEERHRGSGATGQLDQVYSDQPSSLEEGHRTLQQNSLTAEDW